LTAPVSVCPTPDVGARDPVSRPDTHPTTDPDPTLGVAQSAMIRDPA